MGDWQEEQKKALDRNRMLGCQWTKRHIHNNFGDKQCTACPDRFVCVGMKAKRFELGVNESIWRVYHTFAEDSEEARSLFYLGDDRICPEDTERGGEGELDCMEVNEVNARGFEVYGEEELPDIEVIKEDDNI